MTFMIKCASRVQIFGVPCMSKPIYIWLLCVLKLQLHRENTRNVLILHLYWTSLSKPSSPTCVIAALVPVAHSRTIPAILVPAHFPATRFRPPLIFSVWAVWMQGHLGGFSNALTYTHKRIHGCVTAAHIIESKGNFPSLCTKPCASFWKCHECNKE